ncbi:MAG: TIGR03618 family F420-dependent PPOX class oxidoreductase [bacterium]|nr:TIGR03618 family F420-dependent PPOX class oxidoreductase [bacterium]
MRTGLAVEDLGDLFERPLLATLATYRRDGLVLLSPVWFEWREGGFNIAIGRNDVKARHLRRDPRASVVVAEAEPPLRGLEVRGSARLMPQNPDVDRRIVERYIGAARADEYLATLPPGTLVRLEPGELRAWDFAGEHH